MRIRIKHLVMLVLCPVIAAAGIGDWTTFINSTDIRDMVAADSLLWCATNGGVICFNTAGGDFHKYTNSDGLTGNDIIAIERDRRGFIWVALADGRLNIFDPERNVWDPYLDPSGQIQVVHDIFAYGDSVYIASNVGTSLMKQDDRQRWEIPWTAKIGEVYKIIVSSRDIWVVLEESIKKIDIGHPNPQAPNSWTTYDTRQGLPTGDFLTLFEYDGMMVVGTRAGMSFFNGTSWLPVELGEKIVWGFAELDDRLLALTHSGVYHKNNAGVWTIWGEPIVNAESIAVVENDDVWLGLRRFGLVRYDESQSNWQSYVPQGPVNNKISALVVDHDGELWGTCRSAPTAVPRIRGGIFRFDGERWMNYTVENGDLEFDDWVSIEVDNQNRIWAGSWGGGMVIIDQVQDDSVHLTTIDSKDGTLSGISSNSDYVVVRDIYRDSDGFMWMLNYSAGNKRVVAVTDYDQDIWQYFSTLEGIGSALLTEIVQDSWGRLWIGTDDKGLCVIEANGTPFLKNDDDLGQGLSTTDGLESQTVSTVAEDMDGVMWIGTPKGLNYWFDGSVGIRYNVINDNINKIMVDSRNNKWIGTSGGMSMLESDGYTWTHYSTSNSPVVADNVICFAINDKSGELFIGTTYGLSRFETPFTQPAASLSAVSGYPNPFVLDSGPRFFYIDNLTSQVNVRIYTESGHLVRHIPESEILGSRAIWDGTNDRGKTVASGIYLYLVTDEKGSKAGKVAVIRP